MGGENTAFGLEMAVEREKTTNSYISLQRIMQIFNF